MFWLALWTLGGVLAWREVLRLLAGRDRLVMRPDALVVERGFGLFRARQEIPRTQVRRFHRRTHGTFPSCRLAQETELLRAELAASGRLGRWVAGRLGGWVGRRRSGIDGGPVGRGGYINHPKVLAASVLRDLCALL